ncbi:hypothetical protein GGS26DRAFT_247208 [Hypomontagnella submonticulosa]|nr:hypothetical protein GGS26DRAFT_247208 [Hypomontagnella submonticulosa]
MKYTTPQPRTAIMAVDNADSAEGGRPEVHRALQVCSICKLRKKKCDKLLPSCGYCVRKGLNCTYESRPRNEAHAYIPVVQSHTSNTDSASSPLVLQHVIPIEPGATEANLYRQVLHLIRQTGQFIDDISAHYFQGIHRYLPVISRTRFHKSLITLGAIPSAGFSTLLLSICVATLSLKPPKARSFDGRSLRLTAKSFLAQVQASYPPSLDLIQARLLLAVHDHTCRRPDEAFDAIAGCARMAYATGLHLHLNKINTLNAVASNVTPNVDTDLRLEAKEAANTWWGIIICERTFFCEVAVPEQPLVTVIPNGDSLLPTEPEILEQAEFRGPNIIPQVSVSSLSSVDIGGFGRAAQAAWLLDQVLNGFKIQSFDSKLSQLEALDSTFQTFLGVLMQQSGGKVGKFCEAVAITIRALFTLHWHLSNQPQYGVHLTNPSLEDWLSRSDVALDTVTKMVLDIIDAHNALNITAPSYSFIIQAALKYVRAKPSWKNDGWLQSTEERLRTSLDQFNEDLNRDNY